MKSLTVAVLAALLCSLATAQMLAFLVSQRSGTSVTGQPIWICTYRLGNQQFERYYPTTEMCPPSVMVQ